MPPIASATVSSQEPKAENIAIDVASRQLLQQAIDLLETLQDDHYTHCSIVMPGGTIGKHVRHICDHFRLLYESYVPTSEWTVDYDIRKRNNPIETDKLAAIEGLKRLQTSVKEHSAIPLNTPLTLLAAISPEDTNKYRFESSFGRELFYSCLHAIHHYASIKAICIELGLNPPKDFGMAPSTLQDQMR